VSCSGLPAAGFSEWDGQANEGDLPQSAYRGSRLVRSRSADHDEAVSPRLYSVCTARQDVDNKVPQFLLPSLVPLYANTSGELGHQVAHTLSPRWKHNPLCHWDSPLGHKGYGRDSALAGLNNDATM